MCVCVYVCVCMCVCICVCAYVCVAEKSKEEEKKSQKRKHFSLNAELLLSDKGLKTVNEKFPKFKFKGPGYEVCAAHF